jgi:hypothetical protein
MALNVPTITANKISAGPGRLYLGAAGTTPSTDVGAITEDGIAIEATRETVHIRQGNPMHSVYACDKAQDVMISVTGIEWNLVNGPLPVQLGAAATSSSASEDIVSFGGDPLPDQWAIKIEHQMHSGQTMLVYGWKGVADGGINFSFNHDEHKFPMKFRLQRSSTDWAGAALPSTSQLFRVIYQKT